MPWMFVVWSAAHVIVVDLPVNDIQLTRGVVLRRVTGLLLARGARGVALCSPQCYCYEYITSSKELTVVFQVIAFIRRLGELG